MKNKLIILFGILLLVISGIMAINMRKKSSYNSPYIPENFEILKHEYNNGLVIKDDKNNEFVWIPVHNVDLKRKDFQNNKITSVNNDEAIDRIYYGEETKYSVLYNYENKNYSLDNFINSVKKHGGFYISRYEISEKNNVIYSKRGYYPLTNITRDEALEKAINMYSKNNDIISSLTNSYAYDTMLEVITKNNKEYLNNKNNETSEIKKTSENEDVIYNIYDLSGNVSEWTTEYSNNGYYTYKAPCVQRGENYRSEFLNPTTRQYNGIDAKNKYIGFRVILYIK